MRFINLHITKGSAMFSNKIYNVKYVISFVLLIIVNGCYVKCIIIIIIIKHKPIYHGSSNHHLFCHLSYICITPIASVNVRIRSTVRFASKGNTAKPETCGLMTKYMFLSILRNVNLNHVFL